MTTMMTLTPLDFSAATQVRPRIWRKQILPLTTITYEGREITFDRGFLMDLAKSHANGAYDQVPFQFADSKNRHNEDPRNYGGEIKELQLTDDGLDAIIELTPEGEKLIRQNPKLGVSARILQGVAKADGRTFRRAVRHVLATMDPRVTGMRPWQAVDLSGYNGDEKVVDLTSETYQPKGTKMPKTKTKAKVGTVVEVDSGDGKGTVKIDLSKLTDEQFESLLDLTGTEADDDDELDPDEIDDEADEDEDPDADDEGDEDEDGDEPDEDKPTTAKSKKKSKTKVTVEKEGDDAEQVTNGVKELAALSTTVNTWRADQARSAFKDRKKALVQAGVPPFLVDLAEPVLSRPDPLIIDLSETGGKGTVDATKIIDDMLDGMKGMIDLSPEIGHSIDLSHTGDKKDPDAALLKEWEDTYGM